MIVPLLGLTMLATIFQQHTTHNSEAPATTAGPPADAAATNAAANGEATEAAEPAAEEAEAAADEAADAGEDAEEETCRRVTTYDDFGRRRTRRVCTPR